MTLEMPHCENSQSYYLAGFDLIAFTPHASLVGPTQYIRADHRQLTPKAEIAALSMLVVSNCRMN